MRKIRKRAGERKNHTKILQIVGYKNSGKTTLLQSLMTSTIDLSMQVATIKHHGHGGTPEPPPANTDSARFFEAGAVSSMVTGGGITLIQQRTPGEDERLNTLDRHIKWTTTHSQPDLILVEGFKSEAYPKIVLIRSLEDWISLQHLSSIMLVIAIEHDLTAEIAEHHRATSIQSSNFTIYNRDQHHDITSWFTRWLKGAAYESL
ncbi:molybdopterin-guanine dinucleotide biosynthesis protein B [Saccharibacillus sp. JS10]|uniref:molybdopterin-guanine dinucleotide biosynthesis protein B n=1 Tax=Saccharibacillus sp. JS10 TaxID=2950552 RepID=UPI00210C2590|nr:molybdopterin-guanine dinucleotide biosynthesis protein B [Saccharibacillus sp. JS10]MCQ4085482.1 molybdopterin-guanine dinucleotide biosynthesis protein B [Saccharibacillus sp. JS10]